MRINFLFLLLMPTLLIADMKQEFSCTPINGESSFRIKGHFKKDLNKPHLGFAHSFSLIGKFESLPGCRDPWYEKFPLKGTISAKMMLHSHEYTDACMLRLHIPTVSTKGYLWVYKPEDIYKRSTVISANCVVNKVE